jgi:hypothetical protein
MSNVPKVTALLKDSSVMETMTVPMEKMNYPVVSFLHFKFLFTNNHFPQMIRLDVPADFTAKALNIAFQWTIGVTVLLSVHSVMTRNRAMSSVPTNVHAKQGLCCVLILGYPVCQQFQVTHGCWICTRMRSVDWTLSVIRVTLVHLGCHWTI